MKKFTLLLITCICVTTNYAQILFVPDGSTGIGVSATGNVGIGTNSPSNQQGWNQVLDVRGYQHAKILVTTSGEEYRTGIFSHNSGWHGGGGFIGTESNHNLHFLAGYDVKMTILTNGNVGIGTESPQYKLDINGGVIRLNNSGETDIHYLLDGRQWEVGTNYAGNGTAGNHFFIYDTDYRFTVQYGTGYVGIGTRQPLGILHINGNDPYVYLTSTSSNANAAIRGNGGTWLFGYSGSEGFEDISIGTQDGSGQRTLTFAAGGSAKMKILANGNIGIGVSDPGNYKLNIAGRLRADEITVNTTGADFVFHPSYKLISLPELETYIKTHQHLPDITPAAQMQEEGISVSEMQTKLLQKVEELTLYMIEQEKAKAELKGKIAEQEKKNAELEQKLADLEKKFKMQ